MINLTKRVIFQTLECAPQPIVIVDAKQPGLTVAYVNPAFEALTGLDPRFGSRVEPIKPVSEEDMERFLTALFTPK